MNPDKKPAITTISKWSMLLALAGVVMSGCAGVARGVDSSVYTQRTAVEAFNQSAPEASALVVIRYPAMIHADAESFFVSSFAINAIGGVVPNAIYGKTVTSRIAQSVIAKSSYYAMSLYSTLKDVLPEETVLLSPHIIVSDEARNLYSRPILAAEQIPSALTIDFNIYSYPDATELMDSPPVTFGDLVTPLIVVKSDRWINPALNGLLISSEPLVSSALRQSSSKIDQQLAARLADTRENQPAALEFIAHLGERGQGTLPVPVTQARARIQTSAVEQYPLEKIQMDGMLIANLEEEYAIDPFARDFVQGVGTRIIELLNSMNIERATFLDRQTALSRFDPELGRVFFLQSNDESVRARLQLAEALVGAERKFLAAQADSVYAGTYSGSYGDKMRKIIEAEYRMLEERRRMARTQNMTTAVAAVALAGSVYGATVSTTASALTVASLSGLSLVGSVWALNRSLDARADSEQISESFIARMAPTFERQMSVQMEWLESKEMITARGFAEFRNKTLSLYQARVRSLTVAADERCSFMHPDFEHPGRWYGQCAGGRASGRGYGLIRTPEGDSVEFIGNAHAGMALGTGAMILRQADQLGSTYYEGDFSNGRPDGIVMVEQAGQPRRYREFRAGIDVGKGDENRMPKVSFSADDAPQRHLNP